MALDRVHYQVAIRSAERIRKYWREHDDADEFEPVEVKIVPFSYELETNLEADGYPPRRK